MCVSRSTILTLSLSHAYYVCALIRWLYPNLASRTSPFYHSCSVWNQFSQPCPFSLLYVWLSFSQPYPFTLLYMFYMCPIQADLPHLSAIYGVCVTRIQPAITLFSVIHVVFAPIKSIVSLLFLINIVWSTFNQPCPFSLIHVCVWPQHNHSHPFSLGDPHSNSLTPSLCHEYCVLSPFKQRYHFPLSPMRVCFHSTSHTSSLFIHVLCVDLFSQPSPSPIHNVCVSHLANHTPSLSYVCCIPHSANRIPSLHHLYV